MTVLISTNIELLVLHRPKTVLEQYRLSATTTNKTWLLVTDTDAELNFSPIWHDPKSEYDFISFKWVNAPKFFNRNHFGIGLYKVSKLREILDRNLTSAGLDLILAYEMKTEYSETYTYTHDTHLTLKRCFRYGLGRAYFVRTVKPYKKLIYRQYLIHYLAYFAGFLSGLVRRKRDQNW